MCTLFLTVVLNVQLLDISECAIYCTNVHNIRQYPTMCTLCVPLIHGARAISHQRRPGQQEPGSSVWLWSTVHRLHIPCVPVRHHLGLCCLAVDPAVLTTSPRAQFAEFCGPAHAHGSVRSLGAGIGCFVRGFPLEEVQKQFSKQDVVFRLCIFLIQGCIPFLEPFFPGHIAAS